MIEITTVIPRQFIEGRKVHEGRVVFDDGELSDQVIGIYEKNPKFTVRKAKGAGPQGFVTIEQAICAVVEIVEKAWPEGSDKPDVRAFLEASLPDDEDEGGADDAGATANKRRSRRRPSAPAASAASTGDE